MFGLGTLMPYVQYLMFSQAMTADLQGRVTLLTREVDAERRKARTVVEEARVAEERAAALERGAEEHENQHRALEFMVARLTKKLDVCTNDRGVLGGELGTAIRRAESAIHLELVARQCEEQRRDELALQLELKHEVEQMEAELSAAQEAREGAEQREAQQRALATRIKGALVVMRKEESAAGKAMASAFSAAALAEMGGLVDKKKGALTTKLGTEEEEEVEEEEAAAQDNALEGGDGSMIRSRARKGGRAQKRDAFGRVLPDESTAEAGSSASGMIKSRKERSSPTGTGSESETGKEKSRGLPQYPAPPYKVTRLEQAAARAERRRAVPAGEGEEYDYRDTSNGKDGRKGSSGDFDGIHGEGEGQDGKSSRRKDKIGVSEGGEGDGVKRIQDRHLVHRLDTAGVKALPLLTRLPSKQHQDPSAGNQYQGDGRQGGSPGATVVALARAARASRDRDTTSRRNEKSIREQQALKAVQE